MKKIIYLVISTIMLMSCSNIETIKNSFMSKIDEITAENKLEKYKLEAKIKTNKGDINIFLYPEAAPETVANFVYLSKKNVYDNMKFHRVLPNVLIQSGDVAGDTTGNVGYYIKDEISDWLTFDLHGLIAMANTGEKNTASSQFFITLIPYPNFTGSYTAFGSLKSKKDINVAKSIRVGDVIEDIEITGVNVNQFLDNFKEQVEKWDREIKIK